MEKKLSPEAALAEMTRRIAQLEAENNALKSTPPTKVTLKVSEKGAVSAYGLGRFPVTLYGEQWVKLLGETKAILAFIEVNKARLSTKADKAKREAEAAGVQTVVAAK